MLWLAAVDEERAPVEVREALLQAVGRAGGAARCLKAGTDLRDAVLLAGCRSFRIFARGGGEELELTLRWIESLAGRSLRKMLEVARGPDAAREVFRAQAGLGSWLPGDETAAARAQAAYREAYQAGSAGAWSHRVFQRGQHVAKRIRERFGVTTGIRSVGEAAADLALRSARGKPIVVVGLGSAGRSAVRYLAGKGAKGWIACGRSAAGSRQLAERLGGAGAAAADLPSLLGSAAVVVYAAGVDRPLLGLEAAEAAVKARRSRPLALIDVGVPRNVDPRVGRLEGVRLHDLDDLRRSTRRVAAVLAEDVRWAEDLARDEARAFS